MEKRKGIPALTSGLNIKVCPKSKRSQVTIFIIIAIVIVAGVVAFFVFKDSLISDGIPANIEPIYNSFLSCLEENTLVGIDVLESQAGYISLPDFEPGSAYMPFSSQLNFLGNPIPYWYYVSGNNIQKEQVPSREKMQDQLEEFIGEEITECIFDKYYEQGFEISQGEPTAKVNIEKDVVEVSLDMELSVEKGEDIMMIKNHKLNIKSALGMLYDSARKIYDEEQENLFLENYAVDTLRLYAPVDGVELTCSPLTWSADEVFDGLEEAIEANTLALKTKGGDYSLRNQENKYFVVDADINADVRFINSKDWPNSFEVDSESSVLMAKPIGNQPGLGILGFCYVPYHFVYNMNYPVLIQIQSGDEIFQFPVAVVIQGNKPRQALDASAIEFGYPELCEYKSTIIEVATYDTKLNPIEADISYECFGTRCDIGKTSLTESLKENFPQCTNGYILARAEGFEDAKYLYSTIESGVVDIILDKLYEVDVELKLDGKNYDKDAIISFVSDKSSKTVVYPEQKSVELSEGQYEVQVYVYRNSSIKLEETKHEQCMEIPKSGLGGLFGITEEKCFDVKIPSQIISNALSGGGKENYYVLESELESSSSIEINAESLQLPKTIEELQNNYLLFEDKSLDVVFK